MGMVNTTIPQLRNLTKPRESTDYYVTDAGKEGIFKYDSLDRTTGDDNLNTIVTWKGKRIKRKDMSLITVTAVNTGAGGSTGNTNITPPAPTGGTVNDTLNTFTFTLATGYTVNQHEYSLNGAAYVTCTSNIISVGNIAVAIGGLIVRVKSAVGRNAGTPLLNQQAFTVASNATFRYAVDYGVVNSNTLNQTTAMQAALDACTTGTESNYDVLVMPANYNVLVRSIKPRNYTKILGAPGFVLKPYYTGLTSTTTAWEVILIQGVTETSAATHHVTIDGVRIELGQAPGDIEAGFGGLLMLEGIHDILLTNMYISHNARDFSQPHNFFTNSYGYSGIKMAGGYNVEISYCQVYDVDTNYMFLESPGYPNHDVNIHHCIADGGTSEGISFQNFTQQIPSMWNITVANNVVRNKWDSYGISMVGVRDSNIYGNTVETCAIGMSPSLSIVSSPYYNVPSQDLNFYNNTVTKCKHAGWLGGGLRINVYNNYFGQMYKNGIITDREASITEDYQGTYVNIYNNEIDECGYQDSATYGNTFGTGYSSWNQIYAMTGILVKNISNSKIVNNLIKLGHVSGEHWGMFFVYGNDGNTSGYGTGNTFKNNMIDGPVFFNTNNFTQSNTFTGNRYSGYVTATTPGGSWTVSGNTSNSAWVAPSGIVAGILFFYNQTGSNATYNFPGSYKRTDGTVFTNSITLAPEASVILFRSS